MSFRQLHPYTIFIQLNDFCTCVIKTLEYLGQCTPPEQCIFEVGVEFVAVLHLVAVLAVLAVLHPVAVLAVLAVLHPVAVLAVLAV